MNTGQDEEPLPSTGTRGSGGTPPMAETNHGRTNLYKGSNRRAKTGGSTNRKKNIEELNWRKEQSERQSVNEELNRRWIGAGENDSKKDIETRTGRKYRNRYWQDERL
ncbi:unnamed protein product [Brassica napus]|uniref:(rape) hypothetical protein n=1 Tax=Brassica napus TaxID=3708 RepID=A0A816UNF6_BRANA|nr:unnamed protein product [Brassica napus]